MSVIFKNPTAMVTRRYEHIDKMWLRCFVMSCLTSHIFATKLMNGISDVSSTNRQTQKSWQTSDLVSSASYFNQAIRPLNSDSKNQNKQTNQQLPDSVNKRLRSSLVESVINDILGLNRQGRNLEGYDEVYADPEVKNALKLGNDTLARSYIRGKLCSLGLINCDRVDKRNSFYSTHTDIYPQDIFYGQPVTIQSVGRPLPVVPIKHSAGYELSRPLVNDFGPEYSAHSSLFSKPITETSSSMTNLPPNFSGLGLKKYGTSYASKPVYEPGFEDEIKYENKFGGVKKVNTGSSNIQQHVHHHYHHNDGSSVANVVPIIETGYGTNNDFNNYQYAKGENVYNFDEYKKNFKLKNLSSDNSFTRPSSNSNYANRFIVYQKPKRDQKGFSQIGKLGSNLGLYNNINNNQYFGSAFEINNGELSPSYEDDCICLPYDQCTVINQAGRKEDLHLSIDPRSLRKNIEADNHEIIVTSGNGNSSVWASKGINETEKISQFNVENKNVLAKSIIKENVTFKDSYEIKRTRRNIDETVNDEVDKTKIQNRQFGKPTRCGPELVCCRQRQLFSSSTHPRHGQCGIRYSQGIAGRIKTPAHLDGDSEFGEYPWQVAILKKESEEKESIYVCGGTLVSSRYTLTAAHCIKTHSGQNLRARLGEWDVNHDVEFFPYIERDIVSVIIHPEFYGGTLYNDIAILKLDYEIDFGKNPHISPACLPHKFDDFVNTRCWTTGWGKDAFGDIGKYQNILKEVDVSIISNNICEQQMRKTRLGPNFNLHPGFICAGGEEGKDACKGDGGGPMVCDRYGQWQLAGIVSWGIGCGHFGVPGVYTRVSYYLAWISQIIGQL